MALSNEDILYAIETSLVVPVEVENLIWFDTEGIVGRYFLDINFPTANMVGKTNLTPEKVDAVVEAIATPFKERNQILGWAVSPGTKPDNLAEHLTKAGFVKAMEGAGMYLTDLTLPIQSNPDVTVRRATSDDLDDIFRLYTEAYPLPAGIIEKFMPWYDAVNAYQYLAFVEEEAHPVAIASMFYMPDMPVTALQGAATLEAYRGRGIYTSLMAQRLKDAHADGIEAAIMQADKSTSAPICRNLGFKDLCDYDIYAWIPPQ